MRSQTLKSLPLPVRRALNKLGSDVADARKRRRISTSTMAQRAMISRTTLVKVENGDPGVSLGIFATVLFVLGMTDRLADIADASHDRIGLDLESENLPKRISSPRKPKHGPGNRIIP
ncbi:MAG: hypothetical protein H0T64_12395 [Pyrinomonadaceae bacterium]|nr:hypothetical protein [Pyrinomonadaceae bacterium]